MNKIYFVAISVLLTSGCDTKSVDSTQDYRLPEELRDCKVFELKSSNNRDLYVVRCNNTTTKSTSFTCGKNCIQDVNVIE